ncbi:F-box domain-containing protein [Madurella fahalii]|uniref:F-box domain-containing protein n=1 Tax=Madurella fahalii TaxID=1157608 RepID=A0ABQ0GLI2_9PEZI
MTIPTSATVTCHLEKLPIELHEPILANLSFRDIIALAKYTSKGSRLDTALATSPTWKSIWPTYTANQDDFQTLASLIVPVGGGRLFDPTCGALDVTPGQFHRRMVREREIHGAKYNFLEYTIRRTSTTIQQMLGNVDAMTLSFLCQDISLDHITIITPWLKNLVVTAQRYTKSEENRWAKEARTKFFDAMEGYCRCQVYQLSARVATTKPCLKKHPDRPTSQWTVVQIKAFVDAYSTFQTRLNTTKAQQLRTLARLYAHHHARLKEPLAPQDERNNVTHIPDQLETVAGFVSRIIDLDRLRQPGTKQGKSRFRYPHPCLIPYDWCLRLWMMVAAANPALGINSPPGTAGLTPLEESVKELSLSSSECAMPSPPRTLLRDVRFVNEGFATYYKRTGGTAKKSDVLPRTVVVGGTNTVTEILIFYNANFFLQQAIPQRTPLLFTWTKLWP